MTMLSSVRKLYLLKRIQWKVTRGRLKQADTILITLEWMGILDVLVIIINVCFINNIVVVVVVVVYLQSMVLD